VPRTPRELSPSGIYHTILRGINKHPIFDSRQEKAYFLDVVRKMGTEGEYEIYAYCLMNNHVHLLLKTGSKPLDTSMKRIAVSYVYFYNRLHSRSGSLFDNRYTSVVIKDEVQFMVCARYIHNNPVKAGLVETPQQYPWSSYRHYLEPASTKPVFLNTNTLLSFYHSDKARAINALQKFTGDDDFTEPAPLMDCITMILEQEQVPLEMLKNLPRQRRDDILRRIMAQSGAKAKDVAEILGISTTIIYNANRKLDKK